MLAGFWVFRAPVGYRYEKAEEGGKVLVPDPETAPIIRDVIKGFASGRLASQVEVKSYLDRYPGFLYRGRETIYKQRIRDLLDAPSTPGTSKPAYGAFP